jgi:hypothetical protein
MKKLLPIFALLILTPLVLHAQKKTDKTYKKTPYKRTPQYKPYFFAFDGALQMNTSKSEGSVNINSVNKQYVNIGISGGYLLNKHKFEVGLNLGSDNNHWHYTNTRLGLHLDNGTSRPTLNLRLGYNYPILTINDRLNVEAGAGINWLHFLKKDSMPLSSEALDKLIFSNSETFLKTNTLGIDGKIQLNYTLSPHLQVHLFYQYRYAPQYLRAYYTIYYDSITGLPMDIAYTKSFQSAHVLGIGLQYNLRPLFEKKDKVSE